MKKKLEAELISIAHRILKMKNRSELEQLQKEALNLYEKLSVLKFVEDNFNDVKPTIGFASAEDKLEEIYGIEEVPEVKANEQEAIEDKAREEKKNDTPQDKENTDNNGKASVAEEKKEEATETPAEEQPEKEVEVAPEEETKVADTEEEAIPEKDEPKQDNENTDNNGEAPVAVEKKEGATETPAEEQSEKEAEVAPEEETKVADTEEEATPEKDEPKQDNENTGGEGVDTDGDGKAPIGTEEKKEQEPAPELPVEPAKIEINEDVKIHTPEQQPVTTEPEMPGVTGKPEGEGQDKDNGAGEGIDNPSGKPSVSEEEKKNTQDSAQAGFDFGFEKKQPEKKEVSFEDFQNYKEPEFVKKEKNAQTAEAPSADDWRNWEPRKEAQPAQPVTAPQPAKEEPKAEPVNDWRNWEPSKSQYAAKPAEPEAVKEAPKPAVKFNDGFVRALSLGLNDRIAFEKHLFGGSGEDLNRVVSQLNTLNTFQEAQDFINDLVKPDYNNWTGKEEYEERFIQLVEKKFS